MKIVKHPGITHVYHVDFIQIFKGLTKAKRNQIRNEAEVNPDVKDFLENVKFFKQGYSNEQWVTEGVTSLVAANIINSSVADKLLKGVI